MKTAKSKISCGAITAILLLVLALFNHASAQGPVKFKATVTADERHNVVPVCYGAYFVEVRIDEILEGNTILAGVTSVQVCYTYSLGLNIGSRVEVYGTYYPTGSACPKQYCGRVAAVADPYYVNILSGRILYVDNDATGADDGSSWSNAYKYLEDALSEANPGDEIWVAEGTYNPYRWMWLLTMPPIRVRITGDRTVSFQLKNGVAIYGGFKGNETGREQRNWTTHKCILSGDIGAIGDKSDNNYHVVTGSGSGPTAVLNGFIITGGNADGADTYSNGGGMYNEDGRASLVNCKFIGNSASTMGGGIYNGLGNMTLTSCTFTGNFSAQYGGGIGGTLGGLTVTNCTFTGNTASIYGGGIYDSSSTPTMTNCILWGNLPKEIVGMIPLIFPAPPSKINYCDVKDGWPGTGNINLDPKFADADGRLSAGSPCIDAGNNITVPSGITTDLDGNPRFVDDPATADTGSGTPPIVDMGAYEFGSGPSCGTPPAPPTGVAAAEGSGSGTIILRWNKSTCATGYKVFYDDDASNPPFSPTQDGSPSTGSDVGNVTQITISGLTPGDNYCFAVKAYNAAGESDYSSQDCAAASIGFVTCSYSVGDRVILLVDNPRDATGLPAGTCGTVLCIDSSDPELPLMVSWDGWSGGYSDRDIYCDYPPPHYPTNSAYWMACNQIAPGCTQGYFNKCGVLVQGVECVLFQSDTGGLYVLENIGDFQVGDRVRVLGVMNPNCATICMQGDGCIEHAIVSYCDGSASVCCGSAYRPGSMVVLLEDNPRGAVDLEAGTWWGTVICCDYDDPDLPIFVSWHGWTNGGNSDFYCDTSVWSYPTDSGLWMSCDQITSIILMDLR